MSLPEIIHELYNHVQYGVMAGPLVEPVSSYIREQAKVGFDILRAAVAGKSWNLGARETIGLYLTYQRSVEEGAAEPNLRLMAQAMVNIAQEPSFSTSAARNHLLSLASLTREEVVICAAFLKVRRSDDGGRGNGDAQIWASVRDAVVGTAMFPSTNVLWGSVSGLCRTGWIAHVSGFDGGFWAASPQLDDVGKLVDFATQAGRI